jgi:CRISPR/Cas system-associated protein endoribonuclease Cas2
MFGGLQTMWVIVLFDLPTDDVEMKRDYRYFRKFLLNGGFTILSFFLVKKMIIVPVLFR